MLNHSHYIFQELKPISQDVGKTYAEVKHTIMCLRTASPWTGLQCKQALCYRMLVSVAFWEMEKETTTHILTVGCSR